MLGILIDQGMKSSLGIKIRFFNKFVTATPAAALLAMRCKSPVLPGFCTRNADGTFAISIAPPLVLKRTGGKIWTGGDIAGAEKNKGLSREGSENFVLSI